MRNIQGYNNKLAGVKNINFNGPGLMVKITWCPCQRPQV